MLQSISKPLAGLSDWWLYLIKWQCDAGVETIWLMSGSHGGFGFLTIETLQKSKISFRLSVII